MTDSLASRLQQLEILFTEQEYTIQLLNDRVALHDQEISRLLTTIGDLEMQLQALKAEQGGIDPASEKPPHY